MGCQISHNKIQKPSVVDFKRLNSRVDANSDGNNNDCSDSVSETIRKNDRDAIEVIIKDMNETPELFVLNNIMMAMMFLENYQKDMAEATKTRHKSSGNYINPDPIFEKVNQNVTYRPLHGPNKHAPEPLVTKRIYVPDDSVEVFHPMDVPDPEKRSFKCQLRMEDSKRKGFVKLQELGISTIPNGSNLSTIMSDSTPSISESSSDTDSSDTPYRNSKTPKPMESEESEEKSEKQRDLNSCFVYRKRKKPSAELDLEEMDPKEITEEDVYDRVSYLNSQDYMKYFRNNIFPNSISTSLDGKNFEMKLAKWLPGKIFCNLIDINDNNIPCELIPCVRIPWPDNQTLQFTMRETIAEEEQQWPTQKMLNDIKQLECAVVPKGYVKKNSENAEEGALEWEIHFPNAERYLESCMSHAQIRCLLVLLSLHKTYIESVTHQHGLLAEHIYTHIYWEIEKNYRGWPEHRLGIKMIIIIKDLLRGLRQKRLNDYFVQKKNLLQNIPSKYIEHSNKMFHLIVQSPLMYFIKALRNIRYKSGKFYPPLDFKELQRILTNKEMSFLTPLDSVSLTPSSSSARRSPIIGDAEMQLKYAQELRQRDKILKQREQQKNGKKSSLEVTPVLRRRDSVDSIDLEWTCEDHFDLSKKHALLVLFINTYINIAITSSKIGSHKQTLFYLKQAYYLSVILGKVSAAFEEEAELFLSKIRKEEDNCKNSDIQNAKQNSASAEKYHQLKNSVVDLNRLNNSYNGQQVSS